MGRQANKILPMECTTKRRLKAAEGKTGKLDSRMLSWTNEWALSSMIDEKRVEKCRVALIADGIALEKVLTLFGR
jgi:hypothetical protein